MPALVNFRRSGSINRMGISLGAQFPRYNRETEEAMRESLDIAAGKIQTKAYHSAEEMFADLDAEDTEDAEKW